MILYLMYLLTRLRCNSRRKENKLHEVFFTECYTLIDALIWMALGIFAGYAWGKPDNTKNKKKRRIEK